MAGAKLKRILSPEKAAESISAIALGLATGKIKFGKGFSTKPKRAVKLEVRGKESSGGGKVTIEVSWKADADENGSRPV